METHEWGVRKFGVTTLKSQKGKMLAYMAKHSDTWFLVVDFQRPTSRCFIWYEAWPRLSELANGGFVVSRWSEKKFKGARRKEHKITLEGVKKAAELIAKHKRDARIH